MFVNATRVIKRCMRHIKKYRMYVNNKILKYGISYNICTEYIKEKNIIYLAKMYRNILSYKVLELHRNYTGICLTKCVSHWKSFFKFFTILKVS